MTTRRPIHVSLAFNESHPEIVNPVVEGSVYARHASAAIDRRKPGLPVLIHGDSAVKPDRAW